MESRIQYCPGLSINGANYSFILFDVDGAINHCFKTMRFWFRVDRTEADSCKRKYAVLKISGFVWTPHTPPTSFAVLF